MSWLLGSRKPDRAQILRTQTAELLAAFPGVVSPIDELRFSARQQTIFGLLTFYILLPPDYPERPPRIQVAVPVTHPWVDANGVVTGLPLLRPESWNKQATLVQCVQPVIAQFDKVPPTPRMAPGQPQPQHQSQLQPQPQPQPAIRQAQPLPVAHQIQPQSQLPGQPALQQALPLSQAHQRPPVAGGNRPPEAAGGAGAADAMLEQRQFGILDSYGISQLEEAMFMDDALDRILAELEPVKRLQEAREQLYAELEQLAESNLQHKQSVEQLTHDVLELKQLAQERQAVLRQLYARQQAVARHFSPQHVLTELDHLVSQAEEASDEIYDAFNGRHGSSSDSDTETDNEGPSPGNDSDAGAGNASSSSSRELTAPKFVKSYKKARQKYHMLAAKRERFAASALA